MKRPRVLITRTRHQASELAAAVERIGAEAVVLPLIELGPPASWDELDRAIALLGETCEAFDWLIFTSANAVQALVDRASALGARLQPKRIAVIGPATARAVVSTGLKPVIGSIVMPKEYVAESLAETLLNAVDSPQSFLLVRAEEARDVIPAGLLAAGHRVHITAAYRNETPRETLPALRALFEDPGGLLDMITFTSSSTVHHLVLLLASIGRKIPEAVALASIGPITSATLRDLGYQPKVEASEPTIASLTDAIAEHLKL